MAERGGNNRLAALFPTLMGFCVLAWVWSFALYTYWPWSKGGEWLPAFPIVAVCSDDQICTVPYGELAASQSANKVKSLLPEAAIGETTYESFLVRWKLIPGGIETKLSSWNYQTTVRYRIEDDKPVLVEYQEITVKVFLIAIVAALVSLGLFKLYARRKRAE